MSHDIPVLCFTCGKMIANKYKTYQDKLNRKSADKALDEMRIFRICCRRMFISHNPQIKDDMLLYSNIDPSESPIIHID